MNTTASIIVFDMNGKTVRSISITSSGAGTINFTKDELPSGMYYYSLLIDGIEIDTKKMIISQ
jgi:hypothetical protein